jgi:hypothetical protein
MPKLGSLVSSVKTYGLTVLRTYAFGSVPSSINEGSSGTFNVVTTNVNNGTTLYWYVNNTTTSSGDFSATSGSFTITNNAGSFSVTPTADSISEGTETFTVSISKTSGGTALATTGSVTVNDTSQNTPTISYPTVTTYNTPFTWSISNGAAGETWYSVISGAQTQNPGPSGTLDASGATSYSDGSFGTNYGAITVVFTFSKSTNTTITKNVTNQPPLPTVTYPSTTARYPTTFSWSMIGQPNETVDVTWSGANSGSYTFTLDANGIYSNGGTSYFVNAGTVNLTFIFNNGYRITGNVINKSITVT